MMGVHKDKVSSSQLSLRRRRPRMEMEQSVLHFFGRLDPYQRQRTMFQRLSCPAFQTGPSCSVVVGQHSKRSFFSRHNIEMKCPLPSAGTLLSLCREMV